MSFISEFKLRGQSGQLADVNSENQLHVVQRGKIDTNNSSTVALAASATFTGVGTDILDYGAIGIMVYADVAGSLAVQFSPDNTNWYPGETFDIAAGATKFFTPPTQGAYFRVVYTNGGTLQTAFCLCTTLKKQAIKPSSHNIDDPITDADDAELVKAVITGKRTDGDYDNVNLTNGNNLKMSLEELESGVSVNSNSQLKVTPYDSSGTEHPAGTSSDPANNKLVGVDYVSGNSGVDSSTETIQVIDYEHHEIHAGNEYRAGFQKDIPNGGTAAFEITTPDTTKWLHFKLAVDVEVEAEVAFYENPDSITSGTSVTPRNANRNSANTSGATCSSDPTYTLGSAIPLGKVVLGSGKSTGGESASANEWVLKQNTSYLVVVTNQAAGSTNECNIRCRWYEHTNKN